MLRVRSWWQAVFLGVTLWCGACAAASQVDVLNTDPAVSILPRTRPRPAEAAPLLRVDSSLVLIPVHVTNALGASVDGLERGCFHVLEDRVEQTIATFVTEDAPVSVGFVFDISASMRPKMHKAAQAAAAFFRTANREDEFFLVQFNDRARLAVPFTAGADEIYEQIVRTRPNGPTTLIDAIYLSLRQMKQARHARKALVILSDGGDNWSRHSPRQLRRTLLESDVQVFAMGIFDSQMRTSEEKRGPQLLDDLTAETGGRHEPVEDIEALPEISARIGRQLRNQYLLGYYPANTARDGKYRKVVVKVAAPGSREFHTSYRRGYYAPSE
jgi:Ca-activated chloride channel homolog